MDNVIHKVRAPLFPLYSVVRQLLVIWENIPKSDVTGMIYAILDQAGTPQDPVDWSEPDVWISERLTGRNAALAKRIWEDTAMTVNPRHVYGSYLFINLYQLLQPDAEGIYRLTERGSAFRDQVIDVVREIDDSEGILQVLQILAAKTSARFGELVPEWGAFLKEYSKFGSPSTINDTLRRRLGNMLERGLVAREGIVYTSTQTGIDYLTSTGQGVEVQHQAVLRAINAF